MPYSDPAKMAEYMRNRRKGKREEVLKKEQKNKDKKCMLCNSIVESLVYDHDHTTGKGRGLICQRCNVRLGSVERFALDIGLQRLFSYLNVNLEECTNAPN
jgi:hypothetical protein